MSVDMTRAYRHILYTNQQLERESQGWEDIIQDCKDMWFRKQIIRSALLEAKSDSYLLQDLSEKDLIPFADVEAAMTQYFKDHADQLQWSASRIQDQDGMMFRKNVIRSAQWKQKP